MSKHLKNKDIYQFARYIAVGVLNTLVTLVVIYACKSWLGMNIWVSNALGYIAGVINSFLWNKIWVFRSRDTSYRGEALRFAVGFAVCYCLQFAVTWMLNAMIGHMQWDLTSSFTISGYGIATIIGMGVYTIANFVFNRLITFKAS
ncbi:MAG: GtrA family protein [Duncaniella sp.]|nr:GtrA family protein [Duncaniella sp.]